MLADRRAGALPADDSAVLGRLWPDRLRAIKHGALE